MTSAQDAYLGWTELEHADGCGKPSWVVDSRTEYHLYRPHHGGPGHRCPAEECEHGGRHSETTIRVVCRSCGTARLLVSEAEQLTRSTARDLVSGQPPREVAGLYLWPSSPVFYNRGPGPYEFLVSRTRVERLREEDVIGWIGRRHGPRGGDLYDAVAGPHPCGPYGSERLRWTRVETDLRSVAAAAEWIAARTPAADGDA
ncbi:hypothetical protein [Streptomyces sp. H39-S7]|uniref:hypothetical protein n=1 Tax=Streptomyces sp. H39-S7 TaxID=3004357 RepID=UPI0022AF5E74|nr:hypothetical protein [Streptomyces sp. H39-S7]MCZ4123370.1 hypothetical protein [Streptomyces sp. H39-S7]